MSRKRCKRKFYATPAIPITFGLTQAGLNKCRLLGAAAIDSVARNDGTGDHLDQIKQIADYCVRLCVRLRRDREVELHGIRSALRAARLSILSISALREQLATTGRMSCSDVDRQRFIELLDANDAVDSVATRRQSRDAMLEMIDAVYLAITKGAKVA